MVFTQENRVTAIYTPLGKDVLLLAGFSGTEGISIPFAFELDLRSENHTINFEDILGANVSVSVGLADGNRRFFNGLISRFSQKRGGGELGGDPRFSHYSATMVPWFWLLTRTSDSRIFQNRSVPDIVEKIFAEKGFTDLKMDLGGSYEPREYCVQYRETDFNFVSRLLEEEGIFYFFIHKDGRHVMVLADEPGKHPPCPNQASAQYQISAGGWFDEDVITALEWEQEIQPGKYTICDFNFKTPNTDLTVSTPSKQSPGPGEREVYDYPGEYDKRPQGERLSNIRMQEQESKITAIFGTSTCRSFTSGCRFELKNYYRADRNDQSYVLSSITHGVREPVGPSGEEVKASYSNEFVCIPFKVPFRPPRVTPKPIVEGTQTAIVVGPKKEEIYTDKHGRVKVQFHWDREGKMNENSSCWIRVSQPWASVGWGGIFLPRIGHEVIVDFLEGDPDRPIIIGRVYHGINTPPYELPAEKTKSTIKSNSSLGGGGFNEIRFEDKKGEEQVFVHAEKNHDIRVKNDRFEWIGNNRHLVVKKDKYEHVENIRHEIVDADHTEEIGKDRHLKVKGKEARAVDGSLSLTVQGDVIESLKANHVEQVTLNRYIKAMMAQIEASAEIELKCGASSIILTPAAIFLNAPMICINSGSGPPVPPSMGMAVVPLAPMLAADADVADPGEVARIKAKQIQEGKGRYGAPATSMTPHKPSEEDIQEKSWIEIELLDEDDNPVPGKRYEVTLPDGQTLASGTLDEKGFARVEGIDPGQCQITFPELHKEAWERAHKGTITS